MIYSNDTRIKDVVAGDFRAAAIFQKHGLDFCCGGDRMIGAACDAKAIDARTLLDELNALAAVPAVGQPKFDMWDLDLLVRYIVENHHRYVREMLPIVRSHATKVARVHGERHPEAVTIAAEFDAIADELLEHMEKEEQVLFPYLTDMAQAKRNHLVLGTPPFGRVGNPIARMMSEHESAGATMARIRELTSDYTPPADACATYRVLYMELAAFEEDLHMHVHLENNILFPKALAMESDPSNREPIAGASCCAVPAPKR